MPPLVNNCTQADLAQELHYNHGLTILLAEKIVDTFFTAIADSLRRGERVELRGLGSFRLRQRRGRLGRNPKTGKPVHAPPKLVPYFKPGREIEDLLADLSVLGGSQGAGAKSVTK
jgi:integration host factor subunit beta